VHNTIPEIDTRTLMFKFIYFQDLLLLTILGLILWFTKNKFIWFLRIPYFISGMSFAIYLIKDSENNIGKKNIHSVFYFLKRNRQVVKSTTKEDFEFKEDFNFKKEKKKKIKKLDKNILEYQYFISIDDNKIIHHKNNNEFVKIFKIETIDILNLNESEENIIIEDNIAFYRKYLEDFKIISMRFPCDFKIQIDFFKNKLDKEKNEFRKKFLNLKIQELEYLEDTTYNLEFYLYLFSKDYDNLIRQINEIKQEFPTKLLDLDTDKIERIICKLNNMNTKI
jgi:hypothetical protein